MKNRAPKPDDQDFHTSVGVRLTNDLNLDRELRMVKAAILYADKVNLRMPLMLLDVKWTEIRNTILRWMKEIS